MQQQITEDIKMWHTPVCLMQQFFSCYTIFTSYVIYHWTRHVFIFIIIIENYKKIFRGMEIPIKGNTWSEKVSLLPKAIEISTQKTV